MSNPVQVSRNIQSPTSNGTYTTSSHENNTRLGPNLVVDTSRLKDQPLDSPAHIKLPQSPSTLPNPESLYLDPPTSPNSPRSPTLTSLPPFPSSPQHSPRHARDPSRSFFANLKASKSSARIQQPETTIRKVSPQTSDDNMHFSPQTSAPKLGEEDIALAPELATLGSGSHDVNLDNHRPVGSRTVNHPLEAAETIESKKRENSIFSNLMKRNHTNRMEDTGHAQKPQTPTRSRAIEAQHMKPPSRDRSAPRNISPHSDPGDLRSYGVRGPRNVGTLLSSQRSQLFREGGSNLFSSLKEKTARTAGGIGKAGNRLFRGNKPSPEPNRKITSAPQNYECRVLSLPLVAQTRQTRIARRLEDSKDKTEFWMPSLPWRCIDYLNAKGVELEGLYRVPGSELQIRIWRYRFDTEHDINLFDEGDLHDVNIIGSLFKSWLRDLPDEIFPKATQDLISSTVGQSDEAPQLLIDELAKLPPWNYYLLFAITCHLTMLLAHVDKNKMDFHNLQICFAPALKINSDCFRWLVSDWRNCWTGCLNEKEYLEDEYHTLQWLEQSPTESQNTYGSYTADVQDRQLSSAGGGQGLPSLSFGNSHGNRSASQLPELSLPQPISPILAARPAR